MTQFKDFSLRSEITRALDDLGFTQPTEIQRKAIPLLLSENNVDFHGQAQTGTGKTLAFGIPLVHTIDVGTKAPQALVVAPTRELVVQICQSIRQVAAHMSISIVPIYGGSSMMEQISALKKGAHIVVGTPGRLNDHLRRKTLSLNKLRTLVLDEADIMLDMGFKEEVDEILEYAPENRQIWLFSATVKPGISDIMRKHMKEAVSVKCSKEQVGSANTKQYFTVVSMRDRLKALSRFIDAASPTFYGFIFCQTKLLTAEVAEQLVKAGYKANALHGDMSQMQRNRVIKQFKDREFTILVATDVAARGIDVPDITHVVNYSLPEDQESYVHRIGRTGRAGKEGIAISFIRASEVRYIKTLEKKFKVAISPINVPTFEEMAQLRIANAAEYIKTVNADAAAVPTYMAAQKLQSLVDSYSAKEVAKLAVSLLSEKFLKDMKEQDGVSFASIEQMDMNQMEKDGQSEVAIYLGTDDGIEKDDVVEFLKQHTKLDEHDCSRVRVIKRRSFLKLPPAQAEQVVAAIKGKSLCGNKVRAAVSIDHNSFESRGGSRSFGGRGEGRGEGRRSRGGEGRSERRSEGRRFSRR